MHLAIVPTWSCLAKVFEVQTGPSSSFVGSTSYLPSTPW